MGSGFFLKSHRFFRNAVRGNKDKKMGGECHLRRILKSYMDYYHNSRCHRSLDQNAPNPREIEPPERGRVISIPEVGGLHHRYTRSA